MAHNTPAVKGLRQGQRRPICFETAGRRPSRRQRRKDAILACANIRSAVRAGATRRVRAVPFRAMARLAALTRRRPSDIRTLRCEMGDVAQGIVTLPKTETGPRPVVVNQAARAIRFRALESSSGSSVVPNPHGTPYSRVDIGRVGRIAARRAGLQDFPCYDLRHQTAGGPQG